MTTGFSIGPNRTSTAKAGAAQLKTKNESKALVKENPDRIALYVTNVGTKAAYLGFGTAAVAEKGIYLAKEGGSMAMDTVVFTGEVFAIGPESEPILSYVEL